MIVINCKNYAEATGSRLTSLVRAVKSASARHRVRIAIAPPPHLISSLAHKHITLLAQHVDDYGTGSTTGYVVPELLKSIGVSGSIINHSEHRVPVSHISSTVRKLRQLGMISIVCSRSVAETKKLAALGPDYVAIEPPSLIGSGIAISRECPDLIRKAALALKGRRTQLLCGAGIVSGEDVAQAYELGARGVLVASGVVKSPSPSRVVSAFAASSAAYNHATRRKRA